MYVRVCKYKVEVKISNRKDPNIFSQMFKKIGRATRGERMRGGEKRREEEREGEKTRVKRRRVRWYTEL